MHTCLGKGSDAEVSLKDPCILACNPMYPRLESANWTRVWKCQLDGVCLGGAPYTHGHTHVTHRMQIGARTHR